MKKLTTLFIFLGILGLVTSVSAHQGFSSMPMMDDNVVTSMMRFEEAMMGSEVHEQMEELMERMFAGNWMAEDQSEMLRLMQNTNIMPGMMTMMMRMSGMNTFGWGFGGGQFFWIMWLGALVWLVVGILLAIWLIKLITKK